MNGFDPFNQLLRLQSRILEPKIKEETAEWRKTAQLAVS
jgi:hypothetical protein